MPLDRAALIGCGVTTGLGAAFNTAKIRPGQTAAVVGCGGVGLSIIQGCRIAGAKQIIAVDTAEWKLELAKTLGSTDGILVGEGDSRKRVLERVGSLSSVFCCRCKVEMSGSLQVRNARLRSG